MSSKIDPRKIVFILIILGTIFFFIYTYNTLTPSFRTPDENCNYFFSLHYAQNGSLSYKEDLNDIAYNTIAPLGSRITTNGKIVPGKFIGFPIYYMPFITVIGEDILPYLTPLFACIGIFFIYLLSKTLFGEKNGIITCILLLIFPPFWFWSNFPLFETIFASLLFVIGLSYFFRSLERPILSSYILTAIFLGTAFNIRPDMVLLFIPLFIILLLKLKETNLKYLLFCILIVILVISPILILNNQLYGGYFTTGNNLNGGEFESGTNLLTIASTAAKRDIFAIVPNLAYYIEIAPLFFASLLFASLFFLVNRSEKASGSSCNKCYLLFIILSFIIYVVIYQMYPSPNYRFGKPIQESFIRYLMPLLLSTLPLFSRVFQQLNKFDKRKIVVVLFAFIFVVSSVTYTLSDRGLYETWEIRLEESAIHDCITSNTESDSIICMGWMERTVYPDRRVIPDQRLVGNNSEEKIKMMAEIAKNLLDRENPLYLYKYRAELFDDFSTVRHIFKSKDMKLKLIENNGRYDILYKIEKEY
jgi:4-amino-4-deoxy-L-arabinose transferase-like glycosyltransferase